MAKVQNDPLLQVETTCGSLLYELQIIWDEVGESEGERDKMLLELEQECLEVYRRKVDKANRCRAQLRQAIADSEAELAAICSSMGERPVHIRQSDQNPGSLKEELKAILPQIEEMRKRKNERRNQFGEVLEQIQKISSEIQRAPSSTIVDETDLSLRKLEELHRELEALQKEKSDRLKQVLELLNTLNSLCLVLGVDFKQTVSEVHPSLGCDSEGSKNISNHTIEQLGTAIQRLREVKLHRMQRLQDLGTSMLELWNLMDTPLEEQQMFQTVTCNIAASEHEINEPNMLSVEFMDKVEVEVSRLEELKASKMKELVFKKRSELDEICRKTHLIPESDSAMEVAIEAIESGVIDPSCVLEQIELQIAKVKEEAFSRKEILEKVEKWLGACEEESWLEEYNMDENRYNAGRGAHLTLKRAEKARALVNKLPGMVESLASKVESWERERDAEFIYDGVSLLNMLEEYNILRQQKEQEKKRQRDQKKLQGQLIAEQEVLYGSKPSPMKMQSAKKTPRLSTGGGGGGSSRRLSMGTTALQAPKADALSSIRTTPLSAGRRGLDIAGLPLKKHSLNAVNLKETDSPLKRRPFSPICVKESSKTNLMDDLNKKHTDAALQKTHFSTPSKTPTAATAISTAAEEENWTPKAAATTIPLPPPTPSTATIPMVTAMTPAAGAFKPVEDVEEEVVEYSFEERRAGFVLPRNQLNAALNV